MGQHEDQIRELVLTHVRRGLEQGEHGGRRRRRLIRLRRPPADALLRRRPHRPRRADRGGAGSFRSAIPDFHDTPELVLVEGDRAAYLGTISGKQTGEMFGFPPQDRRMRVWGINIFALNDDELISERWGQFDVLTMMQQLGVAPGPPMPEAPEEGPEYGDPRRAGRTTRRRTSRPTRTSTAAWSRRS